MNHIAALMRAGLVAGVLAAGAPAAQAQTAPGAADAAGVQAAIELQLEAIGRGDFDEAFAYASPAIQRRFMTVANFAEMVRNGYPMVHRAMDHSFGPIMRDGAGLRQSVVITDDAGRLWVADYHMALVDDVWCIDGVTLRPAPQAGA